jgi:hypothetical protein
MYFLISAGMHLLGASERVVSFCVSVNKYNLYNKSQVKHILLGATECVVSPCVFVHICISKASLSQGNTQQVWLFESQYRVWHAGGWLQKAAPGRRSQLSRRDQRLGQSPAANRMQVAERSAELLEQTAKHVVDMTLKGKKDLLDFRQISWSRLLGMIELCSATSFKCIRTH